VSTWDVLQAELDTWGASGETATFWWRDDDALTHTPALEALLARAGDFQVPLCLAVIPAQADASLAARLDGEPLVSVVQHGYAHRNWAEPDSKKAELAANRPLAAMTADLARGFAGLAEAYGGRSRPILVPPWNRIAAGLLPYLPEIGFRGLSAFGTAFLAGLPSGLRQANTHVDPIDWRGTRGFVGEAAALSALLEHLQARRRGAIANSGPTGLLTHHAVEDAMGRQFAERLFAMTSAHPAARWIDVDQVFPAAC
jgi:peptidoglycan/xylan/chitin deacetylase (PgdA/CDA1 family)